MNGPRPAAGRRALTCPRPDPALRAAFLATLYGPPGERVRLSPVPSPAPVDWAAGSWAAGSWAIVTAWNPDAQQAPERANRAAQERLLACVLQAGLIPRPAVNGSGEWAEESLLVPGASLAQARSWGEAFGQKAVLFGVGSRAALVWLPGPTERCWAVPVSEHFGK